MIVAGFGFRSGATAASLHSALDAARGGLHVTHLATLEDKADRLAELAAALALPVIAVRPSCIVSSATKTHSRASLAARGVGSVAEGSALAVAGSGAQLLVSRRISPDRMATCAIASSLIPETSI